MKIIILAAGEGTRLRPHTLDKPKCMVPLKNKPIIDYIVEACEKNGLNDIHIVCGYKDTVLKKHLEGKNISYHFNPEYYCTNMVASLFCASEVFTEDIIISYADIVYKPEILEAIKGDQENFSVVIDKCWRDLWELRMEDPLADAETLKINTEGNIIELGKKARSIDEIQGQYIGLIKIKKEALGKISEYYHSLNKNILYEGKNFDNMFMTTFIQLIIENVMPVKPVYINGGWVEIDSVNDLEIYERSMPFEL